MGKRPEYFDRYETIAFDRTESGVLTVRLHTNNGPVVYSSVNHREWVHSFFDISADRDNRVVILTGTGDEFIARFGGDKEIDTAEQYDEIYWEGKRHKIFRHCSHSKSPNQFNVHNNKQEKIHSWNNKDQ